MSLLVISELGVLLETDWKVLEEIDSALSAPFFAARAHSGNATLQWAEAS